MPCDTRRKPNQTIQQRAEEIRRAVSALDAAIAARKVKIKIGPQGAIALEGWPEAERNNITDACAYRRLMATGSALSRAEFAKAEAMSGRSINRQVIGQGVHSHDNGKTWHDHKG